MSSGLATADRSCDAARGRPARAAPDSASAPPPPDPGLAGPDPAAVLPSPGRRPAAVRYGIAPKTERVSAAPGGAQTQQPGERTPETAPRGG